MKTDRPLSHRTDLVGLLLRAISSIWLGVVLLAVIIVYSSVGSAVPPFRQYFELNEFEYFNHWIFAALMALFCVSLTAATALRIRFNRFNAGVITVHTGLLILAGGSLLYFGRKIEGDVLLWNPRVQALAASRLHGGGSGNPVIGEAVAARGESWQADMPMAGGKVRFEIDEVRHEGLATAFEVKLRAWEGESAEPRSLTLSQADVQKSFVKLNEQVFLQLLPTNVVENFYDNNTPALLVRRGVRPPMILSLKGLPLYLERFMPGVEEIRDAAGRLVQSHRLGRYIGIDMWKLPLAVGERDGADLSDLPFTIEIDGYLPYADLQRTPTAGGVELNPMITVGLDARGQVFQDWLLALRPRESMLLSPAGNVEFRWLGEGAALPEEWTRPIEGRHVLEVYVKDRDVRRTFDVTAGATIKVDGTDYELEVRDLQSDWPLATAGFEGAKTSIARVWVQAPGKAGFERSVLQRYPELNQDRDEAGKKLVEKGLFDENIELRYVNASQPHFIVAAGPDMSPVAIYTAPGGKRTVQKLEPGRSFAPEPGVSLVMEAFVERPRFEATPRVIPVENRRPQAGRNFSLVRLNLKSTKGDWTRRVWLPFEQYNDAFIDHTPNWVSVEIPDFGQVEFLYGRLPRPLPGRVALENMEVHFYPGGNRPSEWRSNIRWEDPATRQMTRGAAFLNNTTRVGPWTLFQSSAATDHTSFTILGVGNRDGVMTMLLGCLLCTVGMMYAFYVKPWLKRRTRDRLAVLHDANGNGESARAVAAADRSLAPVGTALLLAAALLLGSSAGARAQQAGMPNDAIHAGIDASEPTAARRSPPSVDSLRAIQDGIDFGRLRTLMVQHGARYQTLEAWSRDVVSSVHGKEKMLGLDPVAAAFELMLNRAAYDDLNVIYVKDIGLRKHITGHPIQVSPAESRRIQKTGLVSLNYLAQPAVSQIVHELENKMTLKRAMDRFGNATAYYQQALGMFDVVPSPTGGFNSRWYGIEALFGNVGTPQDAAHGGMSAARGVPGVSPEKAATILNEFREFGRAWLARDVAGINKGIATLADVLPGLAPDTQPPAYPPLAKRELEVTYYRLNALTFGWAFYIVALFVSIWAVIAGWNWTRWLAIAFFLFAFIMHALGLGMRWYIVGRVPVANMFEAVVSSAWLGAAVALVLELAMKRRVFVLAGSFLGALSLVLGSHVGGQITQIAPILDDIMLRIHTVLIIASYAIITLGFAVAVCYLVVAARQPDPNVARVTLGVVSALGVCATLGYYDVFHAIVDRWSWSVVGLPVLFAITGALLFVFVPKLIPGPSLASLAAAAPPGAASIVSGGAAAVALPRDRTKLLEAFDLSHMILLHMATISLFVGLVLGAIWADYSWGRPWGWDPKEVFALVTWLFYAILIHVRFKTNRRALWTAVLSCIGFGAMQFNWWVVNFYIVGLHSYA